MSHVAGSAWGPEILVICKMFSPLLSNQYSLSKSQVSPDSYNLEQLIATCIGQNTFRLSSAEQYNSLTIFVFYEVKHF